MPLVQIIHTGLTSHKKRQLSLRSSDDICDKKAILYYQEFARGHQHKNVKASQRKPPASGCVLSLFVV